MTDFVFVLTALIKHLAISLALTLVIEMSAAALLGVRNRSDQLIVLLANVITNPLLVFAVYAAGFYSGGGAALLMFTLALELAATVTEGLIYSRYLSFRRINPYILSILLNLISYSSGLFIGHLL